MLAWQEWLLGHEVSVRLACFVSVFLVMAIWECRAPCRQLVYSRLFRWSNNLSLVVLNSIVLRLLFPVAAVGVAFYAYEQDFGLFNLVELPEVLEMLLVVVLLDLFIYLQHRVFHQIPLLWRLHRVHHADPDYDVTTGARFHPLEIILSMSIKCIAVLALGAPVVAVIVFEILLNASAMFNHSNIRLPQKLDAMFRKLLVTPDMHRVHHSFIPGETNSNFGFALSIWDRIFHTYKAQPEKGHVGMDIGLKDIQNKADTCRLDGVLLLPFRKR